MRNLSACLFIAALGAGCAPIRIATPEPVKIDINVNVDIRDGGAIQKLTRAASGADEPAPADKTRRQRMAEVQKLKDNRVIGENRRGQVEVVQLSGDWKQHESYVRDLVSSENSDRSSLIAADAQRRGIKMADAEEEFARRAMEGSWPGEWIQDASGKWIAKSGPPKTAASATSESVQAPR